MEYAYNYARILQKILDVGEEMLCAGAEVSRVEDSIYRMCAAYGCDRINVFIITSNIQVTMETPDGQILTHIRRLVRYDANFDRLDYLNDLCRSICQETPEHEEIARKLEEVMNRPQQPLFLRFLGSILGSAGFTIFFGGSYTDGLAAVVVAVLIVLLQIFLSRREVNQLVYHFVLSVAAGLAALLLVRAGMGDHADKIMMGGIMLLIPGIALTNAIRDMLIGDIASGVLRLINSLLIAAAVACGFAFSIMVLGGVL